MDSIRHLAGPPVIMGIAAQLSVPYIIGGGKDDQIWSVRYVEDCVI